MAVANEKSLESSQEALGQHVTEWAAERGFAPVGVASIISPYYGIHLAVGSPTFAPRTSGELHVDLWDYLAGRIPSDLVRVTRLYFFDDADISEHDLMAMEAEARSA